MMLKVKILRIDFDLSLFKHRSLVQDMSTASAYTAVIRQDGPWWIGWVQEVPGVNAQEQSREALLESLREVLREALEFNRQDALEAAGPGAEELALLL
jgi:predicted RNase H-like HicB family nuclease